MIKAISFIIFLLLSVQLLAKTDTLSDEELLLICHDIHKTDQSNIKNQPVRAEIFKANFKQIIDIIQKQGYPQFKEQPKRRKDRGMIYLAVHLTFFHILQTNPELLLNDATIALLKQEIDAERLTKEMMRDVLINWKMMNDDPKNKAAKPLTVVLEAQYQKALKLLEIE